MPYAQRIDSLGCRWTQYRRGRKARTGTLPLSSHCILSRSTRVKADKCRDELGQVSDKYADIDFTKFQKLVDADDAGG